MSPDHEAPSIVATFESQYQKERPKYSEFVELAARELGRLATDRGIPYVTVEGRAKELLSAKEKIVRKNYTAPMEQLIDLAGVRIVTVFEGDIRNVYDQFVARFDQFLDFDDDMSGFKRDQMATDQFGYQSFHAIFRVRQNIAEAVEWHRYSGMGCEVQIRSALQTGWAEVSHKIAYKGGVSPPAHIERKLNAISALLEIADERFDSLQGELTTQREEYSAQLASANRNIPINDLSVRLFLEDWTAPDGSNGIDTLRSLGLQMGMLEWSLDKLDAASVGRLTHTLQQMGVDTIAELERLLPNVLEHADEYLQNFMDLIQHRKAVFRADGVDVLTVLVSSYSRAEGSRHLPKNFDWSGRVLSRPTEDVLFALRIISGIATNDSGTVTPEARGMME